MGKVFNTVFKVVSTLIGVLMVVFGAIWILQGLNIAFLDIFMANQKQWAVYGAILALVGAINIPIIKFSVDWWNTLHQPASVLRMGGSAIDASILVPLLVMALAFTLLFLLLLLLAMRNEILRRRVRSMRMMQAASI